MSSPASWLPVPLPGGLGAVTDPVGAVTDGIGRALSAGVQAVGELAFTRMTAALLATTRVSLGAWFDGPWRAMVAVAALVAVPLLLVGVLSGVLAGRPVETLRRGLVVPLLLGPALLSARAFLQAVLDLTDGACALLVQVGAGGPRAFTAGMEHLRSLLGVGVSPLAPGGAPAGLLLVTVLAAVLALVIWIELACRAALLLLLAALVPVALVGLLWPVTGRWARQLVQVMLAVVLSQVVITVVMVLASASLAAPAAGGAAEVDQVAVGVALLLLGSLGLPLTFRVVPHVAEAAAVAGSGALVARRVQAAGTRVAASVASSGAGSVTRLAAAPLPRTPGAAAAAGAAAGAGPAAGSNGLTTVGRVASAPAGAR